MKLRELFSIEGRKILVTGGARGIGMTVAAMLLEEGAEVALADINTEMVQASAKELQARSGNKCEGLYCDVADQTSVAAMMGRYMKLFGRLDGVFNNAGIAAHKDALEVTSAEWQRIIGVNLNGVFYVAQAAAQQFVEQGTKGSIVNTASMSGTIVNVPQCQAAYNASKAAVIHLTKSLAVEWAEKGIRVNCISPGYIATEMTIHTSQGWQDDWLSHTPFRRMGSPEELAGAVLYLLSDASSFTSGCEIIIDGCYTCI
jgi:sorbose reductase